MVSADLRYAHPAVFRQWPENTRMEIAGVPPVLGRDAAGGMKLSPRSLFGLEQSVRMSCHDPDKRIEGRIG